MSISLSCVDLGVEKIQLSHWTQRVGVHVLILPPLGLIMVLADQLHGEQLGLWGAWVPHSE